MNKRNLLKFSLIASSLLVIFGCKKAIYPDNVELGNDGPQVILNNNPSSLSSRVTYIDNSQLMSKGAKAVKLSQDGKEYNLQLIAEVAPPIYEGNTLQATYIDFSGNKVYVSYNTRGDAYLGGIDVFDVSNESQPKLISQAIMPNTDISSVLFNNNYVYLASATDVDKDATLTSPAVLDRIALSNGLLSNNTGRVQLKGYVGKNLLANNGKIYVVSGVDGGLTVVNTNGFKEENYLAIAKSEALINGANGSNIFVLNDKPGQILSLNPSDLSVANTINLGGDLPETASHIEILNDNFLHAAGRAGLNYLSSTGTLIDNLPVPESIEGIDQEDIVTNNVSINNNFIYVANGGAGLYIAKLDGNKLTLVEKKSLGASTNYVKSSGNLIFVATGTGGLKILKLTAANTSSSTVACGDASREVLNSTTNLNHNNPKYYTGDATVIDNNLSTNALFDFCGNLTLNNGGNVNSSSKFIVNGSLESKSDFNINNFAEVLGGAKFKNLAVNGSATLRLLSIEDGEVYPVNGYLNVNGIAEVVNGSLEISNKLSINSGGRLRLVNTNLIVNGDFDLNGTIEFVGACNVTVNGSYTGSSSKNIIGTNTGKQL